MSTDEIYALGRREMRRIRGEIAKVMREVHFQSSVKDFYAYVQNDERFDARHPDELITGFRTLKQRIHAELPRADYEIRPVVPSR